MSKLKKGDIVEIIPNSESCLEVQSQYGKKQIIERITDASWGKGYILKGFPTKFGLPYLFKESALRLSEQQLSFPGF